MPVEIIAKAFVDGPGSIPLLWPALKLLPIVSLLAAIKFYSSGYNNSSERKMHGRVVMVTGGTSGVGAAVVRELATRGAQILLLTQHALSDPFLVQYIEDLREDTDNQLITAEQVDLSSLYSIRTFATKWIDNAPPRRLDMVVLCANTQTPASGKIQSTQDGVELNWQVNYLANFHLLSILSPALRAQPPDRDVRIIFGTCSSYMGGDLLHITQQENQASGSRKDKSRKDTGSTQEPTKFSPSNAYATSKYALTTFALAFQKHLSAFERPDKMPMNTKVILVDPGFCRTPGTRRWLTAGTLWGLILYLVLYPIAWLVLKSPQMGAQSFLHASMEEHYGRLSGDIVGDNITKQAEEGGWLIKECKQRKFLREDVKDEAVQKALWQYSEIMVEEAEKRGKEYRAKTAKEKKDTQEEAEAAAQMREYKDNVGKKEGQRKQGSRRSKKAG